MWRTGLSMMLTLAALAWPVVALIIVFLLVPAVWEQLFGPSNAVYGAIGALVLVIWGSVKMTSLSDRLNGMTEPRSARVAPVAAEADAPTSWPEYNAAIARNKRWAFYRRTRQFDRLRELEEESAAARK